MFLKTTDKVLIAEDDPTTLKNLLDYFLDNGFDVITATNGKEALEKFYQEKPDVVLTDLDMPVMSGTELLATLTKAAPNTPVVVASEPSSIQDVIEALRHGAWDYVAKPFKSFPVVEHVMCKALERARLVEENKRYREALETANQALKKNLDILQEDQEAGRSVQMRMLPEQDVQFGNYRFSHAVAPSLYLSGDFLDYFKINDTTMGFYIADVSGHGASSAFVTVLLKSLMALALTRYQLYQDPTILEPQKLLADISHEIHRAHLGKYLTIVYAVLDFEKNHLDYSIGGHYPNPIWLQDNKSLFLAGKGFPVGIMENANYELYSMDIPKGVKLVLFSDGVTEILTEPDLKAKEKAILNLIASNDISIDYLVDRLQLKDNRNLPDDVTLLIMQRID